MKFKNTLQFYQREFYKQLNLIPVFGCELEFYIVFDKTQKLPSLDLNHFTSLLKNNWLPEIVKDGLDIVEERGLNQFEIRFDPTDDVFKLFKKTEASKNKITKTLKKYGAKALFEAHPFDHQPGSAMHVHLNFSGGKKCSNFKLAAIDLVFVIGGLLHTLPDLMIFFAPNVTSYKRYTIRSMTTPQNVSWGHNNRTTALRFIKNSNDIPRIEHRVAGADANLIEVITAILCGAYTGIKEEILPESPVYGLGFDSQYKSVPLPRTLLEAKKNFTKSQFSYMFLSA